MDSKDNKMAVLIDGDNAQASLLNKMLAEIAKHGSVTIRRIYGDWTTQNMHSWKDALHLHAVQPIQQFRYTVGKNATDSALIIDAMDIMHRRLVEGFCIVSSDSDYTRLATRIREEGFFVMGIGQKKTPKSFVNACDLFIYTENLAPKRESKPRPEQGRGRGGVSKKEEAQPAAAAAVPLRRLRSHAAAARGLRDGGAGERLGQPGPDGQGAAAARPRLRPAQLRPAPALLADQVAPRLRSTPQRRPLVHRRLGALKGIAAPGSSPAG